MDRGRESREGRAWSGAAAMGGPVGKNSLNLGLKFF